MLRLGKGHCDAQAFVAQELPEPSLPPSSGSRCAANICHGASSLKLFRKVTQTTEWALLRRNGLLLLLLSRVDGARCVRPQITTINYALCAGTPRSLTPGGTSTTRHLCLTQVPQKIRTIITRVSYVKLGKYFQFSKCELRGANCNQKRRLGTLLRSATEGRATLQDSSLPQRGKSVQFIQSHQVLQHNMYPLSNQVLHPRK